jgi:hypothetical protein
LSNPYADSNPHTYTYTDTNAQSNGYSVCYADWYADTSTEHTSDQWTAAHMVV